MSLIPEMDLKRTNLKCTSLAAIVLAASTITHSVTASELFEKSPSVFNYNLVEVKYLDGDGADGFGLVGSGDIRQNIALRVDYISADSGADAIRLGATYYKQSGSNPRADLNFSAGLDRVDDEGGIFAAVGVRYALNDNIELNGAIELNTVYDTDLEVKLAGLYELSPGFSALLETYVGDNSLISLGVRFYWR